MIQESKAKARGRFFLPAGQVEPPESLVDAVKREVFEETGLDFEPKRVLMLDFRGLTHLCVSFLGQVNHDCRPKSCPDSHSIASHWLPVSSIGQAEQRLLSPDASTTTNDEDSIVLRAPVMRYIEEVASNNLAHSTSNLDILSPPNSSNYPSYFLLRFVVVWRDYVLLSHYSSTDDGSCHLPIRPVRIGPSHASPMDTVEQFLKEVLLNQSPRTSSIRVVNFPYSPSTTNQGHGIQMTLRLDLTFAGQNASRLPSIIPAFSWNRIGSECSSSSSSSSSSLSQLDRELIGRASKVDSLPNLHEFVYDYN